MSRIAIIGGGISGLAAAYYIRSQAPEAQVTLIEREQRLGGKILTEQIEGFTIEGAPDSFLSRKPGAVRLCEELGIAGRLLGPNQERRKTYVRYDGALYRIPAGLTGLVPTDLDALATSALISGEGRRRLAQDIEIPAAPGDEDESIAGFITRRLGREVFERLVEPLMGGIYAGDAAQLSLAATFPDLRRIEKQHGSLIKGLQAAQGPAPSREPAYPPFVAFPTGMQELVSALQERLAGVVLLQGSGVAALRPSGQGYTIELEDRTQLEAEAVILATPAYVTAQLVAPFAAELAAAHAAIPYASTATISLAFAEQSLPAPLDGFGYVIPRAQDDDVLACTWTSAKWQGRAPAGYALIRLYLGRYGNDVWQRPDEQLLRLALSELQRTLRINAAPELYRIYRWPRSMPQYTLGHPQRLATIEKSLAEHPGLFLAGAAYRGLGIPDCISSGERAAAAALR